MGTIFAQYLGTDEVFEDVSLALEAKSLTLYVVQCKWSLTVTVHSKDYMKHSTLYVSFTQMTQAYLIPNYLLWSPYVIGQTIIFSSCFFLSSFFPHLISPVGDWMFTILWHMVWP